MMLKIQLSHHKNIFLKKNVNLNCNDITQYYCFYCIFDQIIAALVSIKEFQTFKNISKIWSTPDFWIIVFVRV